LQHRRGEHIVDHHLGAGLVGQPGDGFDVDQFQGRIARGLEEHHGGRPGQRCCPLIQVPAVDQDDVDAEARQDLGQDVVA